MGNSLVTTKIINEEFDRAVTQKQQQRHAPALVAAVAVAVAVAEMPTHHRLILLVTTPLS